MDADFWLRKWDSEEIGFHQPRGNPLLAKWLGSLSLEKGARLFLPLCGKTGDIGWLLGKGYRVVGSELSEKAVREWFDEHEISPLIDPVGSLTRYAGEGVELYVGDFFDLSAETLGPVDAVYDRAALVALPEELRPVYAEHLARITHRAPQLLICFEYEDGLINGPPFSIEAAEVKQLYRDYYEVECLEGAEMAGGFNGGRVAETVWLLRNP